MNYIGSKNKLCSFIEETILNTYQSHISNAVFCDLFAGTGIVGRAFKKKVQQVISNDKEFYSYVLNKNYIYNHLPFEYNYFISELNALPKQEGFIFNEYSENGKQGRLYFSEHNGKKIDAIRQQIEKWKNESVINENVYFFLLASLLESVDKIANTASVYGAYLKQIKKTAQKELVITPALFEINDNTHKVYNEDSNSLITHIEGDILYLDPPYNEREYGANYHLLNTIARYDIFEPKGKTGLRQYQRSHYCKKTEVSKTFKNLIANAKFKYIFLSYNNEGLMSMEEIKNIMSEFGKYSFVSKPYQRFKADANRTHKANATLEYIHILVKK